MKRVLLIIALWSGLQAKSQESKDSLDIAARFPTVPPFTIMSVPDSVAFSKTDLKKKTAVLVVYFSPDCDHCKHFTKELLAHDSLFTKVQIVMASSLDFDLIKRFYQENKIADHPNIHMGRDGMDFFRTFYKIKSYPTIILYSKKGEFVKRYDATSSVEKIAADL